jgi:hypothetical protein
MRSPYVHDSDAQSERFPDAIALGGPSKRSSCTLHYHPKCATVAALLCTLDEWWLAQGVGTGGGRRGSMGSKQSGSHRGSANPGATALVAASLSALPLQPRSAYRSQGMQQLAWKGGRTSPVASHLENKKNNNSRRTWAAGKPSSVHAQA